MRQKAEPINDAWRGIHPRPRMHHAALRWLMIEDEFTRLWRWKCAVVQGPRNVLDVLCESMMIRRLARTYPFADNRPEVLPRRSKCSWHRREVHTLYIATRDPLQNRYAESFNSRFRDEVLNRESFAGLAEARQVSAWWKNHYNHRRPHSSLSYQPPARFAASLGVPTFRSAAPLACTPVTRGKNQPSPHRLSLRLVHNFSGRSPIFDVGTRFSESA